MPPAQPHPEFLVDMLVVLMMIASAVAVAVKWVKLPYSIALVLVGLAIGVFHVLPPMEMTPALILVVFLPALLFEASWNLELQALKGGWLGIGTLATVGVVFSMVVIAAIMHFWGGVAPGNALLFGAMMSATDPISVIALFRKMGISKRLTMLLEGESLFNDGTAVVLFQLALAIVTSGTAFSLPASVGNFAVVVVGGILVGLSLGLYASRITSYFEDHLLEITLTTLLAYGSFLVAEQLHVSPVIAVVAAGIVMGNYGGRHAMSATTRLAVNSFWEYAAFVVNSLVFLLIGLQVKFDLLVKYMPLIGVGIVAILAGRILLIYGMTPFLSSKSAPIPWKWRHLLVWGALRGSLSMAMALSLPINFPQREELIITAFGVVLFTLIVQGLTIEPLVKMLKMTQTDPRLDEYKAIKTELVTYNEALEFVHSLLSSGNIAPRVHEQVCADITRAQAVLNQQLDDLHLADSSIQALEMSETRKQVLEVRKDCLQRLMREGMITEEVMSEIMTDIDSELYSLLFESHEPASADTPAATEDKPSGSGQPTEGS